MIFVLVDDIPEMLHTATEEKDSFKDDLKDLLLAYQKLSVKQKEVLYLFYVKGLSHKEISNVLYINYQSSKNRLCQSLVQLRKLFFQIKNKFFSVFDKYLFLFFSLYNRKM